MTAGRTRGTKRSGWNEAIGRLWLLDSPCECDQRNAARVEGDRARLAGWQADRHPNFSESELLRDISRSLFERHSKPDQTQSLSSSLLRIAPRPALASLSLFTL